MRILVTGAGGFIGSSLMDELTGSHPTIGFDNFLTGRRENHPEVRELDILDRPRLYELANEIGPEVVIHCAASYNDPDKWHRDTDTNVAGCINAAAVAKHHAAHLIYFQTILPPVSSYAISKIAGEWYLRLSDVPLTVLRLANIYGPRNLSGPIPVFYKRITNGQPCVVVDTTRDMLFIEDLVRCVRTVVESRLTGTFDVCTGVQTPIIDLFQAVAAELGHQESPPLIPPDPDDVQGTISFDNVLASWKGQPRVPLDEGIRRTVRSYGESGVDSTYTHLRIGREDAS
jgi:UDP-glucose 4-epimerase